MLLTEKVMRISCGVEAVNLSTLLCARVLGAEGHKNA